MQMRLEAELVRQLSADSSLSYPDDVVFVALTDRPVVTKRGRREIEAAAPGHVATVRRLFVDRLTPAQLDAIGDAAESVLAGLDQLAPLPAATGRTPMSAPR